jgi:hypothetical protein
MRLFRVVAAVCGTLALIGGIAAFAAQWMILQPGNFSQTAGPYFIRSLGDHGIYTSKMLGTVWTDGLWVFSTGAGVAFL